MLEKIVSRLQDRAKTYAKEALETPGKGTSFEFGTHHGVLKGLSLAEQLVREVLEEEDNDDDE